MTSGNAMNTSITRWNTRINVAAEVGASDPEHEAGESADEGRGKSDQKRGARSVHDPREQVPPESVGPQHESDPGALVDGSGRHQHVFEVLDFQGRSGTT